MQYPEPCYNRPAPREIVFNAAMILSGALFIISLLTIFLIKNDFSTFNLFTFDKWIDTLWTHIQIAGGAMLGSYACLFLAVGVSREARGRS
jgi:hypothetical protein